MTLLSRNFFISYLLTYLLTYLPARVIEELSLLKIKMTNTIMECTLYWTYSSLLYLFWKTDGNELLKEAIGASTVADGIGFMRKGHDGEKRKEMKWKNKFNGENSSSLIIGTSVRRSSRSAFGRSTGNDVVATINVIIFFSSSFLFSVVYFSHRRSARIKKLI